MRPHLLALCPDQGVILSLSHCDSTLTYISVLGEGTYRHGLYTDTDTNTNTNTNTNTITNTDDGVKQDLTQAHSSLKI